MPKLRQDAIANDHQSITDDQFIDVNGRVTRSIKDSDYFITMISGLFLMDYTIIF